MKLTLVFVVMTKNEELATRTYECYTKRKQRVFQITGPDTGEFGARAHKAIKEEGFKETSANWTFPLMREIENEKRKEAQTDHTKLKGQ